MTSTMTASEKQSSAAATPEQTFESSYTPRFDIWEGQDELLLHGDLPGVAAEDLDVRFENRELSIRGTVRPRHNGDYLRSEYGIGDFHRTFTVGEAIDAEKISAEMKGGVLTLRLPKTEKIKPRRIVVKAN